MFRTVKIGKAEYKAIKELARKRGQYLQFHLNEAIRQYLAAQQNGQPAQPKGEGA